MGVCVQCGTELEPGSRFCPFCGSAVEDDAVEEVLAHLDQHQNVPAQPITSSGSSRRPSVAPLFAACALVVALGFIGFRLGLGPRGTGNSHVAEAPAAAAPRNNQSAQDTAPAVSPAENVTLTFYADETGGAIIETLSCVAGETVVLPMCSQTREGYAFAHWADSEGLPYAPGEELEASENESFYAVWSVAAPQEPAPTVDPGAEAASRFPRTWTGTYEGYSQHAANNTIIRSVQMTFTSVSSDGSLAGTCAIGVAEEGVGAGMGSYNVEGAIDWSTGAVQLWGTTWIDMGDLIGMRSFTGVLNGTDSSIVGTSTDGTHEGVWQMYPY